MTKSAFLGLDLPLEAPVGYTYRLRCAGDKEYVQITGIVPVNEKLVSLYFTKDLGRAYTTVTIDDIIELEMHRSNGSRRPKVKKKR